MRIISFAITISDKKKAYEYLYICHNSTKHPLQLALPPPLSPCLLPKASLAEGILSLAVEGAEGLEGVLEGVVERLMVFPNDERLVHLARDSAPQLYQDLPLHLRLQRINDVVRQ